MKMTNLSITFLLLLSTMIPSLFGQDYNLKQPVDADEVAFLQELINEMSVTDQLYRKFISNETLDKEISDRIDSVLNNVGIEEGLAYKASLNLSLDKAVKDSVWQLQHALDFANHITLRGIFLTYGFLPEEMLGDKFYVQLLLLVHPPKDWDVETYLKEYTEIFMEEVEAGRMPPKTFATFYDNINGKILRRPQLYGTNMQFDVKTNTVLPPMIENLAQSNKARKAIGMPPLKEGEYRVKEGK